MPSSDSGSGTAVSLLSNHAEQRCVSRIVEVTTTVAVTVGEH
jgi:hypothetical protein